MTGIDWVKVRGDLDERGFARTPRVLSPDACEAIAGLYDDTERFRSRIVMRRHAFGEGEYKYFAYPLPDPVQRLRETAYPELAPLANRWAEQLGWQNRFPGSHAAYLDECHAAGQTRPTPLVLKYSEGGYNRLHQDLYGDLHFPVQMAVLLSDPASFEGGQFVLTETRARMQNRAEAISLGQGDAVFFAVNQRPVRSARGYSRATMRHGVSTLHSGSRMTLGVIFHDAR
ncbi:MAG: 2OG-Fe(II) oxygenase [Minwuia sp.]|uniref:2OG-Fe(II) oxygenase n=1 Tax=Minwuia sp. TaxID=2493630 RepID=UPI003A86F179